MSVFKPKNYLMKRARQMIEILTF